MKSLIIGLGFGNAVYRPVLEKLGHEIVTVDSARDADFVSVEEAVSAHRYFDTVNICTPNHTHENIARQVAAHASLVFVEKPGVINAASWHSLIKDFPETRICMVKNNQYRDEMQEYQAWAKISERIQVVWRSTNRIPNPGSWFTTKQLAFGGVSRDLMPHALSYYLKLGNWRAGTNISKTMLSRYKLAQITSTDYGTVDYNGTYDVDDLCEMLFSTGAQTWSLVTDWKSNTGEDELYIQFDDRRFELGLCPEVAYENMILTCAENLYNTVFWQDQLEQDLFIHERIANI